MSCSRTQHGGGRFRTPDLSLWSLTFYHWATALPPQWFKMYESKTMWYRARALRQGEVWQHSGRSLDPNLDFPISSIHFNFSLSSKQKGEKNMQTFPPNSPLGWALMIWIVDACQSLWYHQLFPDLRGFDILILMCNGQSHLKQILNAAP